MDRRAQVRHQVMAALQIFARYVIPGVGSGRNPRTAICSQMGDGAPDQPDIFMLVKSMGCGGIPTREQFGAWRLIRPFM